MDSRILQGTISKFYAYDWKDGLVEACIEADFAGQTFDVPVSYLNNAGHTVLELGETFRVEWPIGIIPRTMGNILPPIEEVEE